MKKAVVVVVEVEDDSDLHKSYEPDPLDRGESNDRAIGHVISSEMYYKLECKCCAIIVVARRARIVRSRL